MDLITLLYGVIILYYTIGVCYAMLVVDCISTGKTVSVFVGYRYFSVIPSDYGIELYKNKSYLGKVSLLLRLGCVSTTGWLGLILVDKGL